MSKFESAKHPRDKKGKFRLTVPIPPTLNTIPSVNTKIVPETNMENLEANYLQHINTPPHISLIVDPELLNQAVEDNLINKTAHPVYPYSIYKYSQLCTYAGEWNEATLAARGLIVHDDTGEIIARPFAKFFNHSENKTPPELMVGEIHVTEKLDGSLGLSFINPEGELEITTAGGFQAEQAAHANMLYNERYKNNWEPRKGYTYMWEIIYPENRIVVNYGDEDDIHLLGAVEIATGRSIPVNELDEWKWKKAKTYDGFEAMDKVVKAPDRSNAEGYIVHFKQTDTRIKVKHEEYVKMHRIMTGVNEKAIHNILATGSKEQLESIMQTAPEEFTDFINNTVQKLETAYSDEENVILEAYKTLTERLPENVSQKDFALEVQKMPQNLASHMFSLKAGRGVNAKKIWNNIEPAYERSFWSATNGKKTEK